LPILIKKKKKCPFWILDRKIKPIQKKKKKKKIIKKQNKKKKKKKNKEKLTQK